MPCDLDPPIKHGGQSTGERALAGGDTAGDSDDERRRVRAHRFEPAGNVSDTQPGRNAGRKRPKKRSSCFLAASRWPWRASRSKERATDVSRGAHVARLFNAYLIVHWNAAGKSTTGADSIWIGFVKRDVRFRLTFEVHNPATRAEAEVLLTNLLEDRAKRRERVLIGFDFPLGLPRGLAVGLNLPGDAPLARGMGPTREDGEGQGRQHQQPVRCRLRDQPPPDRWTVPVLGLPAPRHLDDHCNRSAAHEHGADDLPEFRHVETAMKSGQSVWKLYYNGAVGPQAILGIPMVRRLKLAFGRGHEGSGPFETGLKALSENDLVGVDVVAAEVSLSTITAQPSAGETKDAALVRTLAEHFAKQDEGGKLAGLFAPGKTLAEDVVAIAQTEEGWVLGV